MRRSENYYVCPVFWSSVAFYTGFQFGHLKQKKYSTGSMVMCANRWREDHNVDETNPSLSTCSCLFMHIKCYQVCIYSMYIFYVYIPSIFYVYSAHTVRIQLFGYNLLKYVACSKVEERIDEERVGVEKGRFLFRCWRWPWYDGARCQFSWMVECWFISGMDSGWSKGWIKGWWGTDSKEEENENKEENDIYKKEEHQWRHEKEKANEQVVAEQSVQSIATKAGEEAETRRKEMILMNMTDYIWYFDSMLIWFWLYSKYIVVSILYILWCILMEENVRY